MLTELCVVALIHHPALTSSVTRLHSFCDPTKNNHSALEYYQTTPAVSERDHLIIQCIDGRWNYMYVTPTFE